MTELDADIQSDEPESTPTPATGRREADRRRAAGGRRTVTRRAERPRRRLEPEPERAVGGRARGRAARAERVGAERRGRARVVARARGPSRAVRRRRAAPTVAEAAPSPSSSSTEPPVRGPSDGSSPTPCARPASAMRSPCPASRSSACSTPSRAPGSGSSRRVTRAPPSFMAEAHGQLTGRPAVCLGTRAVGGANLAIGIHTARQNSTPMFAAIGQVERSLRGREAFQEIDQVATLGGLAKWAAEPRVAADVAPTRGRGDPAGPRWPPGSGAPVAARGPARRADARRRAARERPRRPRRAPSDEEIRAVIELLASARRPVILAGAGVLRARTSTELTRFAELLQVPVIAGWRRADVISNDHPLYLGMAGLGAAPSVRERLDAADALLVIGSRLNEATTLRVRRAARRACAGPTSTSSPGRARRRAGARDRPSRPTPRRSCGPPTSGSSAAPCSTPSGSPTRQANNAADRAAWEAVERRRRAAVGRPGRPSRAGRSRRCAGCCRTTRS